MVGVPLYIFYNVKFILCLKLTYLFTYMTQYEGSFKISKIFKTECGFIVMDRFSKTELGFGATSNAPNYFPKFFPQIFSPFFFFSGVRASGSGLVQGP